MAARSVYVGPTSAFGRRGSPSAIPGAGRRRGPHHPGRGGGGLGGPCGGDPSVHAGQDVRLGEIVLVPGQADGRRAGPHLQRADLLVTAAGRGIRPLAPLLRVLRLLCHRALLMCRVTPGTAPGRSLSPGPGTGPPPGCRVWGGTGAVAPVVRTERGEVRHASGDGRRVRVSTRVGCPLQ
ncbi:conserved hypothetical protein [Streptomyces sp. SPB074]|nr:conserved hypothetical protein [Streptomyces sp. SPB074]